MADGAPHHRVFAAVALAAAAGCSSEPWPEPLPIPAEVLAADHEEWRLNRRSRLTDSEGGVVSWIGLWELGQGPTRFGADSAQDIVLPGKDSPPFAGTLRRAGMEVRLEPEKGSGLRVRGGDVVTAPVVLENDRADSVTVLALGSLGMRIHAERGTDRLWLRVWDEDSPKLATFQLPEYYPVRNEWRVAARLDPFPEPRVMELADVTDGTVENVSPGELVFRVRGREHRFVAFATSERRDYFVMLWDSTATVDTYQAGRYLRVPFPGEDGWTTIDFNRTYNPPCVFTPYSVCSLPPRESRLELAVMAGEKRPVGPEQMGC